MTVAPLQTLGPNVSVTDAISSAASATGVDFRYLLDTASRESSLNPQAKSASSSATGLYQFVDQTWFATLKAHGAEHGLSQVAGLINQDRSGRLNVADPADRQAILALRKDPRISSLMAGEFARDSRDQLQNFLGRPVDNNELYIAHFLGPREAARFISEADYGGDAVAAKSFPDAAAANRSVFYDANGGARSLTAVKNFLLRVHSAPPSAQTLNVDVADAAAFLPQTHLPSFSESTDEDVPMQSRTENQAPSFMPSAMNATLRLTPQILQILSSLDPLASENEDKNGTASSLAAALAK